ncbi:hypothetical protein A2U01_0063738, partial [Trifolium medium]|nr:hypothetical protein [Trifolium medium]
KNKYALQLDLVKDLEEAEARLAEVEQKLDPVGDYVEASMIAAASAQFHNVVAQLRILNPNVEFVEDGLDEDKE